MPDFYPIPAPSLPGMPAGHSGCRESSVRSDRAKELPGSEIQTVNSSGIRHRIPSSRSCLTMKISRKRPPDSPFKPPHSGLASLMKHIGVGQMAQNISYRIKRTPWKVDVLDRLVQVEQDIERAISFKGWRLNEPGHEPRISPREGKKRTRELNQAEAVVTATDKYIDKTRKCLEPPEKGWQRFREWLTGELLMSVYTNLHAAETNRVLLLSSDQLAAILPTIRERAAAYLPATDARVVALNGLPDPTALAHQALARVQAALIKSVTQAHAQ